MPPSSTFLSNESGSGLELEDGNIVRYIVSFILRSLSFFSLFLKVMVILCDLVWQGGEEEDGNIVR
jgi:hypothetical protein